MTEFNCNPIPKNIKDMTGQRFGRLIVQSFAGTKNGAAHWLCVCDCGNKKTLDRKSLTTGNNRSCGCLAKEASIRNAKTHGKTRSPEYKAWSHIRDRCHNPNANNYEYYGGRGIVVCDRWRDSFEAFYEDMGVRPSGKHSIDRIDNDGNYEPGNCRWATKQEQNRNSRHNRWITFNGESMILVEWAEKLGIKTGILVSRLSSGFSVEKALTLPYRPGNKKSG